MTRRRGDKESNRRVSASPRLRVSVSPRPSVSVSPGRGVSQPPTPIITLLTDFGSADYFVAAMKGVILSISPSARIVDITHEIPPQDIPGAAFTLFAAYSSFPSGTIHVAVVDPGVGSARRPVLVKTGGHWFVGPDNGIFSYVCEKERASKFFELTEHDYFRQPVSPTFHGRDVFAPVAAALANGVAPERLGKAIDNLVRLESLVPAKSKTGTFKGWIIHIDRFGNCITNLTPQLLTRKMIKDGSYLIVNDIRISSFRRFFSEPSHNDKKLFCIWGSAGFLEIAAKNQSAAKLLNAKRDDPVILMPKG